MTSVYPKVISRFEDPYIMTATEKAMLYGQPKLLHIIKSNSTGGVIYQVPEGKVALIANAHARRTSGTGYTRIGIAAPDGSKTYITKDTDDDIPKFQMIFIPEGYKIIVDAYLDTEGEFKVLVYEVDKSILVP